MRKKSIRLELPLSIVLAFTFVFGSAAPVSAAPEEKVNVLVSFTDKPGPAEKALIHNHGGEMKRSFHIVPTIAASVPKGKLESLRRNPKVTSVEEDVTVKTLADTVPWGVNRIGAKTIQSQTKGQGVKVAILDTGIDLDHPDLRVAGAVSFVPEAPSGDDDYGHGTMVAGVIAALDNGIGIVGVAPEAELYSVKVLNHTGSSVCGSILGGIEWAIDNGMQVINMSFGGTLGLPTAVQTALQQAYEAGMVLVAGAGNSGDQGIIYSPARYEPVIAVGATEQNDTRATFSCTGTALELMAPGVGIQSTSQGGGYDSGSGTSFATPHVAGVAALLIASGVNSNIEVRQQLQQTAEDLGTSGWDKWYGYGLVSATKALSASALGDSKPGDRIPPTTQIKVSGLTGEQGWYRSEVRVEITAQDNAGGSGVALTQYSLDSGKTWETYTSPFTLTTEGISLVMASSQDNAGNEGLPASEKLKIDQTPPSVSITVNPTEIKKGRKGKMIPVAYTGQAEDRGSGLCLINVILVDEYGQVSQNLGSSLSGTAKIEAWCKGGDRDGHTYIIRFTARDYAGNSTTAQATIIVRHDNGREKDSGRRN